MYVTTVNEEEKSAPQLPELQVQQVQQVQSNPRKSVKRVETPIITKDPDPIASAPIDTIPIQTGYEEKRVKEETVESSVMKLRKLSQDFVEKERKKSMEIEAMPITPNAPGDDDYVFSDDDSFDVPDITL